MSTITLGNFTTDELIEEVKRREREAETFRARADNIPLRRFVKKHAIFAGFTCKRDTPDGPDLYEYVYHFGANLLREHREILAQRLRIALESELDKSTLHQMEKAGIIAQAEGYLYSFIASVEIEVFGDQDASD